MNLHEDGISEFYRPFNNTHIVKLLHGFSSFITIIRVDLSGTTVSICILAKKTTIAWHPGYSLKLSLHNLGIHIFIQHGFKLV